MGRFFFDVTDGAGFHRDQFGMECADADDARVQAVSLLPDMAREELSLGSRRDVRVAVRDQLETVIYEAALLLLER